MLCLNHDAAGIEVTGRIKEILCEKNYCDSAYMDITVLHSEFKDWNEDLKVLHGIAPFPAQE
ncbi:toprim domain-containing protein [Clostridium sp. HBUAS56010]|uniref:toprim domain-containing protein n=1 Tax=Clostridium sp. HBUAS56010 TaxID=2571127 RepID=UPI001177E56B|nr:toprim domain-containing protein [Clostridium sp. HBUAS56010]